MKTISILSLILLSCLFFTSPSFAACTVSTNTVNFVNYDVLSATATDANGSIDVECSPKEDITITIGASPNSGGFNPRQMKHTSLADLLNYNLYTDGARTKIWGDGTGGTVTLNRNNVGSRTFNMVNGRIPPLQNVSGGIYTDLLVVTVYQRGTATVLATSTMNVTVNVIPNCNITSTTTVAFGVYDPLNAVDNTAGTGSFTFVCGGTPSYQLHIAGARQMLEGAGNVLNYELYTDIARTIVWPASTPSSETGTASSGVPVTRSIYGRIFASQDVPAAAYTSMLTVTVTY